MESMRSTWTDERVDDLSSRMDEGFRRVDVDLREIRTTIASLQIDVNGRFDQVNGRFDSLQRTLIQCSCGLAASFVCLIVAFVLTAH
jgi:hypothetical protein